MSKMNFKPVTHVIFDLDGTLLDTEVIYQKVLEEIAIDYGKVYNENLRMKVLGTTEPDTAKIFISELKLQDKLTPKTFLEEYKARCRIALPGVGLMPGAEKLIKHLHKRGIPFAIATSSSNEMVAIKTAHLMNLFDLFHHKVMGSSDPEVKNGKPAPDIYLVCASRFEPPVKPDQCLVFEDAPNGVTSGLKAGMQAIAIPNDATCLALYPAGTTLIMKSLEEFQPEQFGLPPFNNQIN